MLIEYWFDGRTNKWRKDWVCFFSTFKILGGACIIKGSNFTVTGSSLSSFKNPFYLSFSRLWLLFSVLPVFQTLKSSPSFTCYLPQSTQWSQSSSSIALHSYGVTHPLSIAHGSHNKFKLFNKTFRVLNDLHSAFFSRLIFYVLLLTLCQSHINYGTKSLNCQSCLWPLHKLSPCLEPPSCPPFAWVTARLSSA